MSLFEGSEGPEVVSGKSGFFWKDYFAARVSGVEEVEEDQYIDFKIEEDATFCTAGTATKNCIANELIIPLRCVFPATNSADASPYSLINLQDWQEHVGQEIQRWRSDKAYIPILPLPLGQQNIGGEGRALLLHQEMKIESEHIVAGMGCPPELIFGGTSWSGSNVSLRMLENDFLRMREDDMRLIKFLMDRVSRWLGWPTINVRFRAFKMADDLQRKAYLLQLAQLGKISDTSLLEESDMDIRDENKLLSREADERMIAQKRQRLAMAEIEGEAMLVTSTYQARAQAKMQQMMPQEQALPPGQGESGDQTGGGPAPALPPGPEGPMAQMSSPLTMQSVMQGPGQDVLYIAQAISQQISQLPEPQQEQALQNLEQSNPVLAEEVRKLLGSGAQQSGGDSAGRPLPEQRPPRRGPESALI